MFYFFILIVVSIIIGIMIGSLLTDSSTKSTSDEGGQEEAGVQVTPPFESQEPLEPPNDVVTLAPSPSFFKPEEIKVTASGKSFFLDFPEKLKVNLPQDFEFNGDFFFDENGTLQDLAVKMNLPELDRLIEKHRKIVAWDLIHKAKSIRSNPKQVGLYSLNTYRTNTEQPRTIVEMQTFNTDYFTHQVMQSVYRELKESIHPIVRMTTENIPLYNAFLTCIETNSVLLVYDDTEVQVLVMEDVFIDQEGHSEVILTIKGTLTSKATLQQPLDLEPWLLSTLRDFVGISRSFFEHTDFRGLFHTLYLDRQNLRVGFVTSINTEKSIEELVDRLLSDGQMTLKFTGVPLEKEPLENFLESIEFSAAEAFALEQVAMLNGVDLFRYSQNMNALEYHRQEKPANPTVEIA